MQKLIMLLFLQKTHFGKQTVPTKSEGELPLDEPGEDIHLEKSLKKFFKNLLIIHKPIDLSNGR